MSLFDMLRTRKADAERPYWISGQKQQVKLFETLTYARKTGPLFFTAEGVLLKSRAGEAGAGTAAAAAAAAGAPAAAPAAPPSGPAGSYAALWSDKGGAFREPIW